MRVGAHDAPSCRRLRGTIAPPPAGCLSTRSGSVDGLGEPAGERTGAERQRAFGDQLAAGRADCGHADQPAAAGAAEHAPGSGQQLHEAACLAGAAGPVGVGKGQPGDPGTLAVRLERLRLSHADPAHLGVGEHHPWDCGGVEAAGAPAEHVADRQPPLLVGHVGEPQRGGAVADRVDVRPAGPQPAVHHHRAVGGHRHAGQLQPQPGGVGGPPGRDQQMGAADTLAVGKLQDGTGRGAAHHHSGPHRHPIGGQRLGDRGGRLRLLGLEDPLERLEQDHLGAQAGERLGQLHPHGPTPEHQQPLGQLAQPKDRLVGERPDRVQALHRRDARAGAGRDHEPVGHDAALVHLHRVVVQEASVAGEQLDPLGAEPFRGLLARHLFDHTAHPLHHPAEVDLDLGVEAVGGAAGGRSHPPGRLQQRL